MPQPRACSASIAPLSFRVLSIRERVIARAVTRCAPSPSTCPLNQFDSACTHGISEMVSLRMPCLGPTLYCTALRLWQHGGTTTLLPMAGSGARASGCLVRRNCQGIGHYQARMWVRFGGRERGGDRARVGVRVHSRVDGTCARPDSVMLVHLGGGECSDAELRRLSMLS